MFNKVALVSFAFVAVACGQQVGTITPEKHPTLPWWQCINLGANAVGCNSVINAPVVLDSNWRWAHNVGGTTNCYTGNTWNANLCPDGKTCAANCALEGADYSGSFGITTSTASGGTITLKFVTSGAQRNIGSRSYLMLDDSHYQLFKPLNQEFAFDVDVSKLPCGLNAALSFVQMDADGGTSKYPTNKAGAKYGTGYCDSKCPRDLKFINGEANSAGWTPSLTDNTAGTGNYGSCCNEMNIWEANSVSAAYTAHAGCVNSGQYRCKSSECNKGEICFPDGCEFNSYRMGNTTFYGKGLTVDTTRPFTVVTQFLSNDNTKTGALVEIRRLYVQNGKVITNSKVKIPGLSAYNSITDQYCDDKENLLWDDYSSGRLSDTGKWFASGAVLAMSIRDDHDTNMLWLDSAYPTTADPTKPGVVRGTCATNSGNPSDIEVSAVDASVTFSYIRFGDIGSTYNGNGSGSGSAPCTPTSSASVPTQTNYGQCGGIGYSGPTLCACGSSCIKFNDYYSQCAPDS